MTHYLLLKIRDNEQKKTENNVKARMSQPELEIHTHPHPHVSTPWAATNATLDPLVADNGTCVDKNKCGTEEAESPVDRSCVNLVAAVDAAVDGGYRCECNVGLEEMGMTSAT